MLKLFTAFLSMSSVLHNYYGLTKLFSENDFLYLTKFLGTLTKPFLFT